MTLSTVLVGCVFGGSRGADTPEEVVEQYLSALENEDLGAIVQLIPKSYSSENAVEAKISRFGGRRIENYEVAFSELKPTFVSAKLKGHYISDSSKLQNFDDTLMIAYEASGSFQLDDGNWYLLLGDGNVSTPDIQPAKP